MRRRIFLAATTAAALGLAGCGLSERPYEEKRDWPLTTRRPEHLAANPRGKVILLRSMQAGPGLETRGLRSLRADGSVRSDFYETWAVPPAQGVEAALRDWLSACGRYAAVLAPGSRVTPDLILETTLTEFVADPPHGRARAAMTLVVLDNHGADARVRTQRVLAAEAPLAGDDAPAIAHALLAALASLLESAEQALAGLSPLA